MSTVDIYHRNLWKTRAKLAFAIVLLMGASLKIGTYSWKSEEIGLRMALGTQPAQVLGLAPAQVIRIVRIGVSLGAAASFVLMSLMTKSLYGVRSLWSDDVRDGRHSALLSRCMCLRDALPG
ncbi:MAG TPA: hypothetical protein VJ323_21685 [Bryobacteraceae bacterium]|nr:hypothetical protein [Bryobacteraceae bacterium]